VAASPEAQTSRSEPPGKGATPPKKGSGPAKGKGKGATPPPPKKGTAGKGKGAEPRKPDLLPRVPLKKLFWTPISLGAAPEERSPKERSSIWDRIDQDTGRSRFNAEELEALFAEAPPQHSPVPGASGPGELSRRCAERPRAERRRLFEEQRRRQVWFMLALMPEQTALLRAVELTDDAVLPPDRVELLLSNLPTPEEESMLREAAGAAGSQDREAWDEPEAFMLLLMAVPEYELRVRAWAFLNSFECLLDRLGTAEAEVRSAGECLQESPRVERLLGLILEVGNYLNAGTARGRADGFELDTLPKLGKLKAPQSMTLLDFIVTQLERESPGLLRELFEPGAEFEQVHRARRHGMAEAREELQSLVLQAKGFHSRLSGYVGARGTADGDSVLARRAAQVAEALQRLQELGERFERWGERYASLCAWFRIDPQKGLPSDEFFGTWNTFLTDVKRALENLDRQQRAHRAQRRVPSLPPMRRSTLQSPSERAAESEAERPYCRRRALSLGAGQPR